LNKMTSICEKGKGTTQALNDAIWYLQE